jgi:hypothetical protein
MKNKINSLQTLRARKNVVVTQLEQKEAHIKYNLYLYSHPAEWITNALTTPHNRSLSANNDFLVKAIRFSRKTYEVWNIASKVIKLLRKK